MGPRRHRHAFRGEARPSPGVAAALAQPDDVHPGARRAGRRESIPARVARATVIVLVDMPLWIHFQLAAERQIAWATGRLEHPPAGIASMPPTAGLFETIWTVDRDWMPEIRRLVDAAATRGVRVTRIPTLEQLDAEAR